MAISTEKLVPDSEVFQYKEQGFLLKKGLVDQKTIEALRADTLLICRGKYAMPNPSPKTAESTGGKPDGGASEPAQAIKKVPDSMPDAEVMKNFLCIHFPHKISPLQRDFLLYPGIAAVLTRIISPNVKCMQSMLFVKPPGLTGQAWHQDEIYIPTRDRSLCGVWIALDDATIENGCLWVIPGSHKKGVIHPMKPHNKPDEWDFAGCSYGFDESQKVSVEAKAGDVIFFNGYLLHSSLRNRSKNQYRRALANHYMSAESLLPWHGNMGGGQGDYRDVVLVAGQDPYAYKGTEDIAQVWVREYDRKAAGVE